MMIRATALMRCLRPRKLVRNSTPTTLMSAKISPSFRPTKIVREAAARVAELANLEDGWLNDAVKGLLGDRGEYDVFREFDHLHVFVARPTYLLAMKCAAMRLGAEFHDLDDVRYLLRYLNISTRAEAMRVVTQYFDEAHLPPKTRLALEELLPE